MYKIFIYLIFFTQLFINSCRTEEEPYNPCLNHFQIEALRPSTYSLDWIPYTENQELLFSSSNGKKIKLARIINNDIVESLVSQFEIQCPNDSSQISHVEYKTSEYQNKFIVTEGKTSLQSIEINVDVLLDEKSSNLADSKLTDILKIDFNIKIDTVTHTTVRVLQFPVLDRGFKDALADSYKFFPFLILNNSLYSSIYSNYANEAQLKVYYSDRGMEAFEIEGDLFIRIQ